MPKIIRVQLTEEERRELNRRSRERELAPRMRERLEMVRLSDLGYEIPEIAVLLERHQQTVRRWVKAFIAEGFEGLADEPIPGAPPRLTSANLEALERMLDESARSGTTWTLPSMVAWLKKEHGVEVSEGHLSVRLKQRGFRWKRTYRSVRHKQQDADLQAEKEAELEALNL